MHSGDGFTAVHFVELGESYVRFVYACNGCSGGDCMHYATRPVCNAELTQLLDPMRKARLHSLAFLFWADSSLGGMLAENDRGNGFAHGAHKC